MKHFNQIFDLPVYENLAEEYAKVRERWNLEYKDQICLLATPDDPANPYKGAGSLAKDWENAKWVVDEHGNERLEVKYRDIPLEPTDFSVVADQFKGTVFEEIYLEACKKYNVILASLFRSKRKTCLTWHVDPTKCLHFPIKTQEGCFMIIEDEVHHMPQNTWWKANTTVHHTAMNASNEDRLHLLLVIDEK